MHGAYKPAAIVFSLLQLGATCHATVSDVITHVVSTAQDTDKMYWAKRHNRHRVSVNWLYVSGTYGL